MNCFKTVRTTAIDVVGDIIELVIPDMELRHGQHIRICFAQTPPANPGPAPLKVDVVVNGQKIPVAHSRTEGAYGAIGFLYTDQLAQNCDGSVKARQYIDVIYGADAVVFAYVGPCRCLPRANIEYPRIPAPPAPPAK